MEGSLEPELMLEIAERNGLMETLKFRTVEELHTAYNFKDLQSFLDLYYAGSAVLLHEKVRSCGNGGGVGRGPVLLHEKVRSAGSRPGRGGGWLSWHRSLTTCAPCDWTCQLR